MSTDQHVQQNPRDYRSSDEEVEDIVHLNRKHTVASNRCLIINLPKSRASRDDDSLDDSDDDDDCDSLRAQGSPQPQQRNSILNHTSNSQIQQQVHNHHPHIHSNHSGNCSNDSDNSTCHSNNNHSIQPESPSPSVPVVSHIVQTSTGSHVVSPSGASIHRSNPESVYYSKGENGQQQQGAHQVAYRVVHMSDLQSHHHPHHHHHLQSSPIHHPLNNHPAHHSAHHSEASSLLASPTAAILTTTGHHFHPHVTGNGNCSVGSPATSAGYAYVMMTSAAGSSGIGSPASPMADQMPIHGAPGPRKKSNSINVADLSVPSRTSRDERRRATHNEVERRRRDKINNWITKLAKLVPDCNQDHTKQGQSKGGILAKTCDHIYDLEQRVNHYREIAKDRDILASEVLSLREQLNSANSEIRRLRSLLSKQGVQEDLN